MPNTTPRKKSVWSSCAILYDSIACRVSRKRFADERAQDQSIMYVIRCESNVTISPGQGKYGGMVGCGQEAQRVASGATRTAQCQHIPGADPPTHTTHWAMRYITPDSESCHNKWKGMPIVRAFVSVSVSAFRIVSAREGHTGFRTRSQSRLRTAQTFAVSQFDAAPVVCQMCQMCTRT